MKTIFTLFAAIILIKNVSAQPGTLDSSFDKDGKVVSETYEGRAYASLLQPDGKILLGGSGSYYKSNKLLTGSLLARYNTDGTPDLSFADSGRGVYILGDTGYYIPEIKSMALQPDGKIVALGTLAEQNGFLGSTSLMRFNADGSADKTFGIAGLTVSQISEGIDRPKDLALLPDGRIVVAGDLYKDLYSFDQSFIACYTPDGILDKSFGNTGVVKILKEIAGMISSVAITANGKIVAGGISSHDEALLRYNGDGTPDLSFGKNGLATIPFKISGYPGLNDIAIDKLGRITTGGTFYLQSGKGAILASRFTEDGYADNSFSDNGYTYTPYETGSAYGNCVTVQENGKTIVGGYHLIGDSAAFTIIRYSANGSIDSSFGTNGIQNTFFYGEDIAYSIKIQADGKIILAGQEELETGSIVEIARYIGDNSQKQIIITKIKKWLQHHNGFTWNNNNNAGNYVVQRSYDGINFNSIARINAGNNSNYTYSDPSPLNGDSYYRLQTTSVNGTVNYSNVIAVTANEDAIKVSPNPAKNNLHIEGLPSNQKVKLTVIDFTGNIKLKAVANNASYNFNIATLTTGNYLLKIEMNGEVVSRKFVKE